MRNFWARFAAEFWRGFDEARAQSALSPSTAAPIEIDASHPFFASDEYKRVLAGLIRAAFADGEQAEKTRIFAITRLPEAAGFPRLALHLATCGSFSAEQASRALADAEFDVSARLQQTESSALESTSSRAPTLH